MEGYPVLRSVSVGLYQFLGSALARAIPPDARVRRIGQCFFGFHDKSPWNAEGDRLLAHRFSAGASYERADPIEIGLVSADLGRFEPVARTRTWNWQQGAMLQWCGTNGFAFSDDESGLAVTRVVEPGRSRTVEGHIATISSDGKVGIGYSLRRMLVAAPAYGYWAYAHDTGPAHGAPADDGLYHVSLTGGQRRLMVSLAALAESSKLRGFHYVTHAQICHGGHLVAFFHRCQRRGAMLRSRLIVSDLQGNVRGISPVAAPSHFCWDGDDELIISDGDTPGPRYWAWRVGDGSARPLLPTELRQDGHPQVNPRNNRLVLTDTYPDRKRVQRLLLVDRTTETVRVLCEETIPFRFRGDLRCDYHPRWNADGTKICIDTASNGMRSLGILTLDEVVSGVTLH